MGRGIRNSEYFYNNEHIAVFVPCRDGGSEFWILVEFGINRLQFCSDELWAGGSEILNLRKKESPIGAWSLLREIEEFDGIGKLDVVVSLGLNWTFLFSF